jgi:transcriptional regulator with XRE-family HTH domain
MAGRSSRLRCSDCPPGALGGLRSPGFGDLGVQERCIDFAACQLLNVERQSRRRVVLAFSTAWRWPLLLPSLAASAPSDNPCCLRHSERVMPDCSAFLNSSQAVRVQVLRNARYRRVSYNLIVLDWYLKEWLKATTTSQAELVRRTDYPKAKVSDLVTGKQRYNRDILNDIASALNVYPFELLMHPIRRNGAAADAEARRANGADTARRVARRSRRRTLGYTQGRIARLHRQSAVIQKNRNRSEKPNTFPTHSRG